MNLWGFNVSSIRSQEHSYTILQNYEHIVSDQSVAKLKVLNISTQTSHTIRFSAWYKSFSFDDFSHVAAVALECIWVRKPGSENKINIDVEMSKVLGFATNWFRSNVPVILQCSVKNLAIHLSLVSCYFYN